MNVGGILNISSVDLKAVNIIQAIGKIRIIRVEIIIKYKREFIKNLFMIIFVEKVKIKKRKD
jgi:hypothetical protein